VAFLNDLPGDARSQLSQDQVGGQRLLDWLEERAEGEQKLSKIMDFSTDDLPQIGSDVEAELSPSLIREYNLRLAHDTLARASTTRD